ncbi:MAG: hypothetical protein ACRCYQ_07670 [Nocardioides sp.]
MTSGHLGALSAAVDAFERSVAACPRSETRSRYLHTAYLLGAQVAVQSWTTAVTTLGSLIPLAEEVTSARTRALIDRTLRRMETGGAPPELREMGSRLNLAMTRSPAGLGGRRG